MTDLKGHAVGTSVRNNFIVLPAHRIRLVPTKEQQAYFCRACGVARFAYNWALAEWQRRYRAGSKPSEIALRKALNAIKDERFPWMREVSKTAPQQAIKNLGHAYATFFRDLAKYRRGELPCKRVRVPAFKKKGAHDSFRADNGTDKRRSDAVQTDGNLVKLPVIGWVRMREQVRFAGRIRAVTISRHADAWYASFLIEVPYEPEHRRDLSTVGVDLGVTALATFSDETPPVPAPRPLRMHLRKLKTALARTVAQENRLAESCESENQARTAAAAHMRHSY